METFKKLFLQNTGLKVISLACAILLWLVSMNINNPQMTQTYSIPITVSNLSSVNENGMVILNETEISKQQVSVKIKATRNDLIALDSTKIRANVDFSPVDITNKKNVGNTVSVTINVGVPSNSYEVIDYYPRTVDIKLDELSTKDIPITVEQSGSLANNFQIYGKPQISPEYVTIKGAKTYIETVNQAKVYVNISEGTSSINDQFEISILDDEDNKINNYFSLSNQSANVNINIQRIDSILIGAPNWTGEPMENYQVVDIVWTPKYVDVIGDEEVISSISFLEIPDINIAGATTDVTQVFDLNQILSEYGLETQGGAENECTVTIKIEEIVTKIIQIPTNNIKLVNIKEKDKKALDMPDMFQVTVSGPVSEITNFDPQTISCIADFSNYITGESDIEVDLTSSNLLVNVESPVRLRVIPEIIEEEIEE